MNKTFASYPDGEEAISNHIKETLSVISNQAFYDVQCDSTYQIQFMVNTDGGTSYHKFICVDCENDPCLAFEISTAIKSLPKKWLPASVNGISQKQYYKMSIDISSYK